MQGLLDASLMQNLQNRFCEANNVYLVCLSRERGVVTKAYGEKEGVYPWYREQKYAYVPDE